MKIKNLLIVLATAMASLAPATSAQAADPSCGRNLWPYSYPGGNTQIDEQSGAARGYVRLYRKLTNDYGWIWWAWGNNLHPSDTISLDWYYLGAKKECHATVASGNDSVTTRAVNDGTDATRKFRACIKNGGEWRCTYWHNI